MVRSWASSPRLDMGQMSSQPQIPSVGLSTTESQKRGGDKRGKSKRSKRKSTEMEPPIDQEDEESALTLMQISKAQIEQSRAPYYKDSHALSAHLVADSPPMRVSTEPVKRLKGRKTNNKRRMSKRGRSDIYEFSGSEGRSNGGDQYLDLPFKPPGQIGRSSPSPYHPNVSPVNALDDIPTDDDDVAAYEEYAKDTASADPPGVSDHDIFSFSQQPPNPFDHDEIREGIRENSQSPVNVHAVPQSTKLQKKKKKRKRRTDDQGDSAHEQGQHIAQSVPESFDDLRQNAMSSADLFHGYKGDDMPIDPVLHSINTLPPPADLGNLTEENLDIVQENATGLSRHVCSQSRKRRKREETQGANSTDLPYMSPYSLQHEQENTKDHVLPGYGDLMDHVSNGNPRFSGGEVEVKESLPRKKKNERKTLKCQKEREGNEKDDEVRRAKKDKAENGGAFSAAEGIQLDAFRDNHCEANDMTISQFNSLIQTPMRGNAQVTALFNEIHDILPYRPRMSVQKFCRRRFHNCSRGAWDADEDELLKYAVKEKGKAWKEIGDSLGRMPEDCRDRWRNYLVNSEHRNREQWTDAEVVNLCTAILECMQLMKEDRKRARDEGENELNGGTESDQEVEDMKRINWQAVSDRMGEHGGGRSRLQCSFKWTQLKKREQDEFLKAVKESREIEKKKPTPVKNPWRIKLASKKVANMKSGDIHAFLQAILETDVPEEGNIPWKSLGDDKFRATWTSTDKKIAWSRLKGKILGSEVMGYRTIAIELLSRVRSGGADALNERWDPAVHGDVSKKNESRRKVRKRRDKGKEKEQVDPTDRFMVRSNEFVGDSDDVDGDVEDQATMGSFEPQGYNRYNALMIPDDMDEADVQEDVFDDGRNANGHLPIVDRDLSPEFTRQLESALNAYN